MSAFILPILFLFILVYSYRKKVNIYEVFISGAKGAIPLSFEIFPFIATIMIAVSLLQISGITSFISSFLSPIFIALGIPKELCELIILRPFTGSGSLGLIKEIINTYGADSYIARCACCIMGCSETIFYVATVYTSQTKIKRLLYAIPIALFVSLLGAIVACLLCKVM